MPINIRMVSYRFWRWIAGEEGKKKNWKAYLYAGSLSFFLRHRYVSYSGGIWSRKEEIRKSGKQQQEKKRRTRMLLIDGLWPASRLARSLHVMLRRWICLRVIFFSSVYATPSVCVYFLRDIYVLHPSYPHWCLSLFGFFIFSLGTVEWAPSSLLSLPGLFCMRSTSRKINTNRIGWCGAAQCHYSLYPSNSLARQGPSKSCI